MQLSGGTRWALRIGTGLTLAFLYAPLVVIAIYAFNPKRTLGWPSMYPMMRSCISNTCGRPLASG